MLDRKLGAVDEVFSPFAFMEAALDPQAVPVLWSPRHDKPVQVGHLTAVEGGSDWIRARFVLFDRAVAIYADEHLEHGSPVSIEFRPVHSLPYVGLLPVQWHTQARPDALCIGVARSAYDARGDGKGARIVSIRNRPKPSPPQTPAQPPQDGARLLRRQCGEVLSIR